MLLNQAETLPPPKFSNLHTDVLDVEDQVLENLDMILGTNHIFYESGGFLRLRFSETEYIKMLQNGNSLKIDMIQMSGRGIEAMLHIFRFAFENGFSEIVLQAQPQPEKNEKTPSRDRESLIGFYSSFGFQHSQNGNMRLPLNPENKRVIMNKIRYYQENGKWFGLGKK